MLLTSLADNTADTILPKVYEAYADAVMKNPFHTPEMPIRSERTRLALSARSNPTNPVQVSINMSHLSLGLKTLYYIRVHTFARALPG